MVKAQNRSVHTDLEVGEPGLEPGTSVLSGLRSNQLSYTPGGIKSLTNSGGFVNRTLYLLQVAYATRLASLGEFFSDLLCANRPWQRPEGNYNWSK
jgi:hypothetical protein